jgi:hypothetical protein
MDKGGRTAALIHAGSAFVYRLIHTQNSRDVIVSAKAKLKEMMVERISVAMRRSIRELSATPELRKHVNLRNRAVGWKHRSQASITLETALSSGSARTAQASKRYSHRCRAAWSTSAVCLSPMSPVHRLCAGLRRATRRRDPPYWRPETRAEGQRPAYCPWTSGAPSRR